jgi:hypothetical protein
MNAMFANPARRGERAGALARLGLANSPTLGTDTPASDRLTRLLGEVEDAKQAGDADALALTGLRIDHLFKETRAARKPDEADQGAEQPPASFDGGVRQRRAFTPTGGRPETSSELLLRSVVASHTERAARDADLGTTIVATDF